LNWYAVYTNPRAEKRAHAELVRKEIESYLPLQRTLRLWSDRKKWVEEPLFRSYIFVNISQSQYFDVLNTPGVVRYITFEGKAVAVPEKQIEAIRYYLADSTDPLDEAWGNSGLAALAPGTSVEVTRGPLKGLTGQLVNIQGRHKFRIQIDALGQFLNLTVSARDLKSC
jgi:transcription antitermination factor NusG